LSTLVLKAVQRPDCWRVKIAWPKKPLATSANFIPKKKPKTGSKNIVGLLNEHRSRIIAATPKCDGFTFRLQSPVVLQGSHSRECRSSNPTQDRVRGLGVQKDYVQGYKWLSLAAFGSTASKPKENDAAGCRDSLANDMTTTQITEAQRLAREWRATPERGANNACRGLIAHA